MKLNEVSAKMENKKSPHCRNNSKINYQNHRKGDEYDDK